MMLYFLVLSGITLYSYNYQLYYCIPPDARYLSPDLLLAWFMIISFTRTWQH